MASVGACLLANEPDGLGAKMLQRRIEGKSWKEIADEFGLGSPSTARKQFTKLTGITDYKSKGDALKAIAGQVGDMQAGQVKAAVKSVKAVDSAKEAAETSAQAKKVIANATDSVFGDKQPYQLVGDIDSMYGSGKGEQVIKLLQNKTGYQSIAQQTGVQIKDIDAMQWALARQEYPYSIWNAYKVKPTSETAFKAVTDHINKLRAQGLDIEGVVSSSGVPGEVVNGILKGTWKLPSPGSTQPYIPPAPPRSTGVIGPSEGKFKYHPKSKWDEWANNQLGNDMSQAELAAVRSYTGSGYHSINNSLREGRRATADTVQKIDATMRPIPFDARVTRQVGSEAFRSLGISSPRDLHNHIGKVYRDEGFLSTTIVEEGVWGGNIKMKIDVPQGTMGRWVGNGISQHTSEKEFILGRGTSLMITGVEDHGVQGVIVHMRVV